MVKVSICSPHKHQILCCDIKLKQVFRKVSSDLEVCGTFGSTLGLQLFFLKLLTAYTFSCFRLKAEFQRYQSYNYNDYYQDYQNYYSQWNYDPYADYNYSSYTPYDSMQAVGECSLGDAVMAPAVFEVKIHS